MKVKTIKTDIFKEGEDIFHFILRYIPKIKENSVIVVTSKIIALAENRVLEIKSKKEKENIIKRESEFAIPTKHVWLTIKDGSVMASAGIDESNANGKLILLPKDSFKSARKIRNFLRKKMNVENLGVLIVDSRTMPLRSGVIGMAVGYAGFSGVKDYKGLTDIFGRRFKFSRVNMADSLAAFAVMTMGEGDERKPLVIIENPPIKFCEKVNKKELYIDIKDDMYGPIFSKIVK